MKLAKRIYVLSGTLRERVTFQDQASTIDTDGSQLTVWEDLSTSSEVWARVEPDTVVEGIVGGRSQARRKWVVTVRHRTDITTKMRLLWRGRVMNIIGVSNPGERRKYLVLEVVETNLVS